MKKKKWLIFVWSLLMTLSVVLPKVSAPAYADELSNVVTKATITGIDGHPLTKPIGAWSPFRINAEYRLPDNSVHQGDTTTITLPAGIVPASPFNFEIKNGNHVIANGKVINENPAKVVLTYTSYVEGKAGIHGNFYFNAQIDNAVHTTSGNIPVNLTINGETVSAGTVPYKLGTASLQPVIKSGWMWSQDKTVGIYQVKVNQENKQLINAKVVDTLLDPGVSYIPGTLEVFEGKWELTPAHDDVKMINPVTVTDKYKDKVTYNGSTLTINIGNLPAGKGLWFRYRTKISYSPLDGEMFKNKATFTNNGQEYKSSYTYKIIGAGGSGLKYEYAIEIHKTDTEGKPLKNVEFDIIRDRSGVSVGKVKTDENGYAKLEGLLPGKYTIREAKTPQGFIASQDVSVLPQDFDAGTKIAKKTIKNAREKTSVSVEKKWVGPAKNEVEVELLADGKATNQKITLNQGTNWKGEFKDLYKYDKDDGHEIEYRVKEKKISGYETVISGTAKSGYTITNTIAGKVSIAVRKEWVGKEGNSATIRLIANGKEILSTTLDSAHNWRHTFAGLEKYKNGVEIKYEIKEDAIANYESEITGNVANGFVVKNTNTEKVSVRVEKKWNGPKQISVKVNLMADGVVHKQIELNEGGSWKGEFKELAKYASDGHEIEYTVKEETPMNYESKITGNQQSGYTITNTNIEKVSVSVEKKWIGKEGALAKVELLADGVVKERVTLSKATNDWKYRFTNLAKYASDGHEIEYTVREEKVEGYETTISGTAKSGYTITNRITGKVTIAVRKKWIGKEGNRVVVNLYANGKKVGSQALTKDKDWQYTFTNLEKYENGQEIEYTVKEEKVEGYTAKIEGDMKSGYTIINKENSKKVKTPRTSDDHRGMMYGGLLMSSIMSMLGIVIMKRREME